jgi:hypothetical protein
MPGGIVVKRMWCVREPVASKFVRAGRKTRAATFKLRTIECFSRKPSADKFAKKMEQFKNPRKLA